MLQLFREVAMNEKLKKYYKEHSDMLLPCGIIIIILIIGAWILYDSRRNERIYHDTDSNVERIEERSNAIGQGLDRVQKRVEQSKETVTGIAEAVADSRKNAETVAGAVERAEQRLDNATQRIGRIKNLISDIEAKHR